MSERRPSKGQPVASDPRVRPEPPPERFGAGTPREPPRAAKAIAPVELETVEELSDADLEEIEELEVFDAPAVPSMTLVATNPSLPPAPISTHRDADARVILVVEDDASTRMMIVRALGLRYTIFEADDGATALSILARIPPPACIVSDWMMPRMDGVALLKAVRADKNMKWTPVILLTAKNTPMDVLEGINAGARGYLAKPFKTKELLDKVATVLGGPRK